MTSYLRYKQQIRTVQDADDDIESWITVRGNHIPIKKGQSKEEAVKSFLKGKSEGSSGKSESSKESASVPEDYKKSVAHYSPEKHAEAANFYGEKMASVQKKANSQTDPNASVYAKQFKEYQDLSHWHEEQSKKEKYDPEFEVVRKNALANGNVYGGKYTQKSKAEAYKEYKDDTSSKENMKKANEFVNGKPETSKKWNGTWKTVKVNGLKNTTYTDPDGLNFAVWESSNDPGWKASNRSTEQFNSEEEAFNAASETLKEHKAKYGDFTNKRNKDFMYKVYKKNFPEQEPEMGKGHSAKMHELFSKHYDTLYKHAEKDVQYGDLVKEFDKKLQSDPEFKKEVQSFVKERGDVLSSDREVKAYMLARNEANKASASTEKPKPSNKTTFYKNVSGKQLWSPAWKGSGRKSGYTAIENQLLTEKEMEKHGFNKESSAFQKMELGKKDHHYMFGARFETKKGNK